MAENLIPEGCDIHGLEKVLGEIVDKFASLEGKQVPDEIAGPLVNAMRNTVWAHASVRQTIARNTVKIFAPKPKLILPN